MMITDQVSFETKIYKENIICFDNIQALFAPLINAAVILYLPLMSGKSISDATDRFYKVSIELYGEYFNHEMDLQKVSFLINI